jgi:hypothetical protein
MRTNDQNHAAASGKAALLSTRRVENRPTPFVFRWRALQHELALKTARLDCFSAERFEIVAVPRPVSPESGTVSRFGKFLLSNLIAS